MNPDQLIQYAANGGQLTEAELQHVVNHVAQAGFNPHALEQVRGRLSGTVWHSQTLRGKDRLPPVEVKYLWHVVTRREWPDGTTLQEYVESARGVVLDPSTAVFTNHYLGALGAGFIRESRDLRGPEGYTWVLVQYRVALGHWTTTFQPVDGLDELRKPVWGGIRWLRQPRLSSEPGSLLRPSG